MPELFALGRGHFLVLNDDNSLAGKWESSRGNPDEAEADARLRAAAPAMLAALKASDEWHDLIRQNYPELWAAFSKQVRAAIAEAEGRANV